MSTRLKPEPCTRLCPLAFRSLGFCSDWVPANPRVAFVSTQPTAEDISANQQGNSSMFRWFEQTILSAAGLNKSTVALASVYRCYTQTKKTRRLRQDWEGLEEPVSGWLGKQARAQCRMFDDHIALSPDDVMLLPGNGLVSWNPNCFFVCFSLENMRTVAAMEALGIEIIQRAAKFAEYGYRPVVLLGDEAFGLVAPWLAAEGGHKNWFGHWWEGGWPEHARPTNVIHEVDCNPGGAVLVSLDKKKKPVKQGSLF